METEATKLTRLKVKMKGKCKTMRNKTSPEGRQELPIEDSVKRNRRLSVGMDTLETLSTSLQTGIFNSSLRKFPQPSTIKKLLKCLL